MILNLSGDTQRPAAIKVETGDLATTRLKTTCQHRILSTELLPVMQNMGLVVVDQRPYEFAPEDGQDYGYLYDLVCSSPKV